jgi:DNA-binding transcriptional ArsR family regulator
MSAMHGDADIASIASVIGHPARGRMLTALFRGPAMSASELAAEAGVSASTASAHLAKLTDSGLVRAERSGRRRLHRLADERVAEVIEGLALIAPSRPVRSLRDGNRSAAERAARSCYDHLAGAAGVALTERLCAVGALEPDGLRIADPAPFEALGIDVAAVEHDRGRRPLTRSCLDWSERRPHLAGALGAAVLETMLDAGFVVRRPRGRAVAVTSRGAARLRDAVGLDLAAVAPQAVEPAHLRRAA